jgi:hypothetical protein
VSGFFLDISQKLIEYARNGKKEARQSISDLLLGTVNEDGGQGELRRGTSTPIRMLRF